MREKSEDPPNPLPRWGKGNSGVGGANYMFPAPGSSICGSCLPDGAEEDRDTLETSCAEPCASEALITPRELPIPWRTGNYIAGLAA